MIPAIEWKDGKVCMLDQTKLPGEVAYVDCADYITIAKGIKDLWIRGAPAIGIAAAMGVALAANDIEAKDFDSFYQKLMPACDHLAAQRPTAVNLFWAIDRMKRFALANRDAGVDKVKELLALEAQKVLEEDVKINRAIGESARVSSVTAIPSLPTATRVAGYRRNGTATAPIRVAVEQGKKIKVFADETRPVLQGARLTAWELMQDGIDVTLITDNMAGYFMKNGEIDLAIVGTDRTVRNGDVANKSALIPSPSFAKSTGSLFTSPRLPRR